MIPVSHDPDSARQVSTASGKILGGPVTTLCTSYHLLQDTHTPPFVSSATYLKLSVCAGERLHATLNACMAPQSSGERSRTNHFLPNTPDICTPDWQKGIRGQLFPYSVLLVLATTRCRNYLD